MRKFSIKRDLIIIVLLLLAAAADMLLRSFGGGNPKPGVYAEIRLNGELDRIVYLSEDLVFSPTALPAVVLEVRGGGIAFKSSDCPDQLCVNMGRQHTPGGFAACLPNNLILRVYSKDGGGIDASVGNSLQGFSAPR